MGTAEVISALDAVLAVDVEHLSDGELRLDLAVLVRQGTRVQAAVARLVSELALRQARAAGDSEVVVGVSDTVSPSLLPTPVGGAEAARLARRGHAVNGLPRLSELHAAGDISTGVLDAAAAGLTRLAPDAWPSLDEQVRAAAKSVTPVMVTRLVEQLRV